MCMQITLNITQYLGVLRSECDRCMQLTNELLDFQDRLFDKDIWRSQSKLHSEPQEITDLYLWLVSIIEPFWHITTTQQQILKLALPPNLPCLTTDASALSQILAELLTNACKYTPQGKTIRLSASFQDEVLSLYVANTGAEIPSNQLPLIFERYYRIPRNTPWQTEGTGLGLSLVRHLADHIGATVLADSCAERTLFTVLLPIRGLARGS